MNLMLGLDVAWPPALRRLMAALSFLNVDLSAFSFECEYAMDFAASWRLSACLPLIVVAGYAGFFACVTGPFAAYTHRHAGRAELLRQCRFSLYRAINATCLAMTLLYVSSARQTLEAFSCKLQPDGSLTMPSYPAFDCSHDDYQAEIMPVARAVTVLVVVGFPAGLAVAFFFGRQFGLDALRMCTSSVRDSYKNRYCEPVRLLVRKGQRGEHERALPLVAPPCNCCRSARHGPASCAAPLLASHHPR
jgi:hypothetical protein